MALVILMMLIYRCFWLSRYRFNWISGSTLFDGGTHVSFQLPVDFRAGGNVFNKEITTLFDLHMKTQVLTFMVNINLVKRSLTLFMEMNSKSVPLSPILKFTAMSLNSEINLLNQLLK
jgi:hypothetical protein